MRQHSTLNTAAEKILSNRIITRSLVALLVMAIGLIPVANVQAAETSIASGGLFVPSVSSNYRAPVA
ncbi:MAG: hypothetical protein WDZ49_10225, partial [Litorilinea sp.]